ncbi:MAG TPA: hypothetical protein VK203_23920 [Nostocaceae cyanobacterium]|nr:hypothetical protein [Nostocaceae cyanobacterium]
MGRWGDGEKLIYVFPYTNTQYPTPNTPFLTNISKEFAQMVLLFDIS